MIRIDLSRLEFQERHQFKIACTCALVCCRVCVVRDSWVWVCVQEGVRLALGQNYSMLLRHSVQTDYIHKENRIFVGIRTQGFEMCEGEEGVNMELAR